MIRKRVCCTGVAICLILLSLFAIGQTNSVQRTKDSLRNKGIDPTGDVSAANDLTFFVNLYQHGQSTVRIESSGDEGDAVSALSNLLDRSSAKAKGVPAARDNRLTPLIVVNCSPALTFQEIAKYIDPLRKEGPNNIKFMTGIGQYLIVAARSRIKPPPSALWLKVAIKKNGFIELNGESHGSIVDVSGLADRLKVIFEARRENGVFREGTESVNTTVHIEPEDSVTFWDVLKIELAIRNAGSDRIFLVLNKDDSPELPSVRMTSPKGNGRL